MLQKRPATLVQVSTGSGLLLFPLRVEEGKVNNAAVVVPVSPAPDRESPVVELGESDLQFVPDTISHGPARRESGTRTKTGAKITPTQLDVLRLYASGWSVRDIQVIRASSGHTVRNHLRGARHAYGAKRLYQAVRMARADGLI